MHKVIIDTNVFISGIVYRGNPRKVIEAWLTKKMIVCLSPELKAEILRKLQRKFFLPPDSLARIEVDLHINTKKFVPQTHISLVRDPNDNFLLELAEEANADYIISGDKDLLILKNYKGTKILTPAEFLLIVK
ncbi:putative toxin-antitoxin system toxin component, PIN family [soil metagenome]